jgi:hypothetical protein
MRELQPRAGTLIDACSASCGPAIQQLLNYANGRVLPKSCSRTGFGYATVFASSYGGTIRTCSNWPMTLLPSGCWSCGLWVSLRRGPSGVNRSTP